MDKRWLLLFGAFAAASLCAEVALRVFGIPSAREVPTFVTGSNAQLGLEPDDACFWRLAPEVEHWNVNVDGLRGQAYEGPPGDDTFRIACVGDSCTFGIGVTYEQTYGMRLESQLRDSVRGDVQTVLGATPAFTSHQTRALYEREILELAPDLTVIYCGAWNDYQPKIDGLTDREIATRLAQRSWSNLAELLLRAMPDSASDSEVRVPISDFLDNLARLTEFGRRSGDVILVVPPVRADTRRDLPICLEYQAAVREFATRSNLPFVDAPAIFAACEQRVGEEWTTQPNDGSPLFVDGAHPSPFGHALIADGVRKAVEAVQPAKLVALRARPVSRPKLAIERVDSEPLTALRTASIAIHGPGIGAPGAIRRVWLGDVWSPDLERVSRDTVRASVPKTILPGTKRVVALTARGPIEGPTVEIAAPTIRTGEVSNGEIEVIVEGIAGRGCGVYLGDALATDPLRTLFGRFELDGATRPAEFAEFPPRFPAPVASGLAAADGTWRTTLSVASRRHHCYIQCLVMATDLESQAARGPVGAFSRAILVDLPD